jgi:PII-like signaling protein
MSVGSGSIGVARAEERQMRRRGAVSVGADWRLASPARGEAKLTVTVAPGAHFHHQLCTTEILRRARRARLAGATVLSERASPASLRQVVIVDDKSRLAAFAAGLADMERLISTTLVDVEVLSGPPRTVSP